MNELIKIPINPLGLNPILLDFQIPILNLPLQVRWYGLMYLTGYVVGFFLLKKLSKELFCKLSDKEIDSFIAHLIIGMLIGARVVYCIVYDFEHWSQNPFSLFTVWNGGLSFHGAVIGMAAASYIFARKIHYPFLVITDTLALAGAPGLFFGRIGNFINGELYGRVTDVPWAMMFASGGNVLRHPSMLYEGIGEGILLTAILWFVKSKQKYYGIVSGFFIFGYAVIRFGIEFFREPDAQLGFYLNYFTMGQILCLFMMVLSVLFFIFSKKYKIKLPWIELNVEKNIIKKNKKKSRA